MSDSSYVGDYFYVNEESIKHRHELERQKGNSFVTGSMAGASFLWLAVPETERSKL